MPELPCVLPQYKCAVTTRSTIDESTIEHHFGATIHVAQPSFEWSPTHNVAPSQMLLRYPAEAHWPTLGVGLIQSPGLGHSGYT
jgi:hypothetical protein